MCQRRLQHEAETFSLTPTKGLGETWEGNGCLTGGTQCYVGCVPVSAETIFRQNQTMERVSLKQNRNWTGMKDVLSQIGIPGRATTSLMWWMVLSKDDDTSGSHLISSDDVTRTDL